MPTVSGEQLDYTGKLIGVVRASKEADDEYLGRIKEKIEDWIYRPMSENKKSSSWDKIIDEIEGKKSDGGKPQMNLLSSLWNAGIGAVLTFGARKYADHNWRKGIEVSRNMAAAKRHIDLFNDGQDNDPESGLSHLYHAGCCLMFAAETMVARPDLDDRYKVSDKVMAELERLMTARK